MQNNNDHLRKKSGLYIHIPFCLRRCVYCDFYVEPLGTGPLAQRFAQLDKTDHSTFIKALQNEWNRLPASFQPNTIYIGGGTPTELSLQDFQALMQTITDRVPSPDEWTVECNPGTLSDGHIQAMLDAGVTRVSLGVQSFQPDVLNFLTRIHSADEARSTYQRLRQAGFHNINLDLMFAIPATQLDTVQRDLHSLLELNPEHVSCYSLDYEPNTQLTPLAKKGFVTPVNDTLAIEQFECIRHTLTDAGYDHYEISNYAKPKKQCLNNLQTWQGGDYLGLGPAAASHWQGARWRNRPSLPLYLNAMQKNTSCRIDEERLDPQHKARELLIVSLRQIQGIQRDWFLETSGYDYEALRSEEIDKLITQGLLERSKQNLRLTPQGIPLSNHVFAELI